MLTGGGGHDTFKFVAVSDSAPGATHYDTITDFQHGMDKIDDATRGQFLRKVGHRLRAF